MQHLLLTIYRRRIRQELVAVAEKHCSTRAVYQRRPRRKAISGGARVAEDHRHIGSPLSCWGNEVIFSSGQTGGYFVSILCEHELPSRLITSNRSRRIHEGNCHAGCHRPDTVAIARSTIPASCPPSSPPISFFPLRSGPFPSFGPCGIALSTSTSCSPLALKLSIPSQADNFTNRIGLSDPSQSLNSLHSTCHPFIFLRAQPYLLHIIINLTKCKQNQTCSSLSSNAFFIPKMKITD